MKIINELIELQSSYEEVRHYNKVLKDGSHIYFLKKLRDEFQDYKLKYKDVCDRLEEIKEGLVSISSKINTERHNLLEKEEMILRTSSGEHKFLEGLHVNIENIKVRIKKYEDESLVMMQSEEILEIEKEKLRVELLNIKNNFSLKKEEINSEIAVAQEQIAKIKSDITVKEKNLNEEVKKMFLDLIKKKERAVVPLEGGMCLGCRMKVSALTLDSMHKEEEIVCCNNCGRILFYSEEKLRSVR